MLNEAVSIKNKENAIRLIKSKIEKDLGQKLYKFGEETFHNKFGTQIGIKYFIGTTDKAIRFNWLVSGSSAEVISVDIWDSKASLDKPTIHITTKDISLATIIPELVKLIKSPKVGTIKESMNEAKVNVDGTIFNSKKDAAQHLVNQGASPEEISRKTGMDMKNAVWHHKNLQVTSGTVETHIASDEEKKAETKFKAQVYADPDVIFEDLAELTTLVAKGIQNSLMCTGMAGVGKSFSIEKTLKENGLVKNDDYVVFKGTSSTFGLYRSFYHHKRQLIVFDDCDSVLKDADSGNILKAALDSNEDREISWVSKSTFNPKDMSEDEIDEMVVTEAKYPSKFSFEGQVIFISNLPKAKIEPAIVSRSMTIDVTLEKKDVFKRMQSIIKDIAPGSSMEVKTEVLEFLEKEYKSESQANMRTLLAGIKVRESGSPNWKRLVSLYV